MYEIEIDDPANKSDVKPHDSLVWLSIDPSTIETMSDAEIDGLPFGVICLSTDGTIVRYNLAEARLARLDRAQVLGRNFFREIAKCTACPEFQGRFEKFVKNTGSKELTKFTFLFDFKFGAQLVTVELVPSRLQDRAYLCINRGQILPPRPDAEFPAMTLEELEGKSPHGVLRDPRGDRYVKLSVTALQSLFSAATKLGTAGRELFTQWGFEMGRITTIELETSVIESSHGTLRQLPIGRVLQSAEEFFSSHGWGSFRFDFSRVPTTSSIIVTAQRSALLEGLRCAPSERHGFIEGYLRAILSYLAGRKLTVRFVPEPGQHEFSTENFIAVAPSRVGLLDQLLTTESRTLDQVLSELGKTLPQ